MLVNRSNSVFWIDSYELPNDALFNLDWKNIYKIFINIEKFIADYTYQKKIMKAHLFRNFLEHINI